MKTLAVAAAFAVVLILALVFYLKYRMEHAPDRHDLSAAIDAEAGKLRKRGEPVGLVIGVYKQDQVHIRGYGKLAKEAAEVPDGGTVFQIASVSKLFTASLLQILCDEGMVSLDATLEETIGRDVPLAPAVRPVTLRQLATHTSGFPSIPKVLEAAALEKIGAADPLLDPYSHLGRDAIFAYLATAADKRAAGRFEYSNYGMGLLGHVLEYVAGKDYETLVTEKLLTPLDMRATGITPDSGMAARLAQGHNGKGHPVPVWRFAALHGAGAWHATAGDMLRFVRANLGAATPVSGSLDKTHIAQANGKTGLGWMRPTFIDRFFGNRAVLWHNGMVGGYASYLAIDRPSRTGIVILANQAVDVTLLGAMVMRQARTQSWAAAGTKINTSGERR